MPPLAHNIKSYILAAVVPTLSWLNLCEHSVPWNAHWAYSNVTTEQKKTWTFRVILIWIFKIRFWRQNYIGWICLVQGITKSKTLSVFTENCLHNNNHLASTWKDWKITRPALILRQFHILQMFLLRWQINIFLWIVETSTDVRKSYVTSQSENKVNLVQDTTT